MCHNSKLSFHLICTAASKMTHFYGKTVFQNGFSMKYWTWHSIFLSMMWITFKAIHDDLIDQKMTLKGLSDCNSYLSTSWDTRAFIKLYLVFEEPFWWSGKWMILKSWVRLQWCNSLKLNITSMQQYSLLQFSDTCCTTCTKRFVLNRFPIILTIQ